jgi:hypothetical protein
MVQIKVHQPSVILLCEGALDVKWDHLIGQNPQPKPSKFV